MKHARGLRGRKSLAAIFVVLTASLGYSQQANTVKPGTIKPDTTTTVTTGGGVSGYVPQFFGASTIGDSIIYATGNSVGIGNIPNSGAKLDVNGSMIMRGNMTVSRTGNATSAKGFPSYGFDFFSNIYNSSTKKADNAYFQLQSEPTGNNTSSPSATFNLLFSNNGATAAETGFYINPNGTLHFASAQTFPIAAGPAGPQGPPGPAASVVTDGVTLYGDGSSGSPLQVSQELSVSELDSGYVNAEYVRGDTSTEGEVAVQGNAGQGYGLAGYGSDSNGYGLYAQGNIAIYSTSTYYAGDFGGNVYVGGTLQKPGGSFKIDHPTDPENKYLSHSFVESPDMMNIYNGNVITDGSGTAIVTMPDWFEALNRDFRYQLTIIGQVFAQALVASEIANGSFTIRTDKPNIKVSWMVTGIRKDAWANAHRIPVEEEKSAEEKGHYLHPELFGHQGEPGIMDAKAPKGAPVTQR